MKEKPSKFSKWFTTLLSFSLWSMWSFSGEIQSRIFLFKKKVILAFVIFYCNISHFLAHPYGTYKTGASEISGKCNSKNGENNGDLQTGCRREGIYSTMGQQSTYCIVRWLKNPKNCNLGKLYSTVWNKFEFYLLNGIHSQWTHIIYTLFNFFSPMCSLHAHIFSLVLKYYKLSSA